MSEEEHEAQMNSDNRSYFYFLSISSNALLRAHHMAHQRTTNKYQKRRKKTTDNIKPSPSASIYRNCESCSVLMTFIYNHTKQRRLVSTKRRLTVSSKTIRWSRLFFDRCFFFRQVLFFFHVCF